MHKNTALLEILYEQITGILEEKLRRSIYETLSLSELLQSAFYLGVFMWFY